MWESLVDLKETEGSPAPAPAVASNRRPPWLWTAAAVGVLLLAFLALWASGVIKIKTPEGYIVLIDLDPQATVLVDGTKAEVHWPDGGGPAEITVVPGEHVIQVKKDGFKIQGQKVTVERDGRKPLLVQLEPLETPRPGPDAASNTASRPTAPAAVQATPPADRANPAKPSRMAQILEGSWEVQGDELVHTGEGEGGIILLGDAILTRYDMKFKAKIVSGDDGFAALFHCANDDDESRAFHIGDEHRRVNELLTRGERTHEVTMPTETGRWYDVRIEVRDAQCTCYLNDRRLFQGSDENLSKGRVGLIAFVPVARFKDIIITTPDGKTLWSGPPNCLTDEDGKTVWQAPEKPGDGAGRAPADPDGRGRRNRNTDKGVRPLSAPKGVRPLSAPQTPFCAPQPGDTTHGCTVPS
jgi:hypothetical protein